MLQKPIKLNKIKQVYMIGIKGTGMASLAVNLKNMGIKVSGSDSGEIFFTDRLLEAHKIKALSPFGAGNVPADADLIVVSTAYNNKNPEVKEALRRDLPLASYPEIIGLLSRQMKSVAVCGSHGKTTTSAALAYILSRSKLGVLPNVGSIVPQLINYKASKPKIFVYEADEYQNKFKYFEPNIVILTNIDYDHPDFFKTKREYFKTFIDFIKRIPGDGLLIYCADDKDAVRAAKYAKCKKISYGRLAKSKNLSTSQVDIKLSGEHNALNMTAAALCASNLGVAKTVVAKAVAAFKGTKRRLEFIKKTRINGHSCVLVDDYGHHPTEIKATISALKEKYLNKVLWTVFQPHTFSRTEALFDDFTRAFGGSDKAVILDIYASARENPHTRLPQFSPERDKSNKWQVGVRTSRIHSKDLVRVINSSNVFYKKDINQASKFLKQKINAPSVIMTIGASNIWELHDKL